MSIKDERDRHDDGMYHRFIFIAPDQVEVTAEDLYKAPRSKVNLSSIFLFIQMIHKQFREYTFTEGATKILIHVFDTYGLFARTANKHMDYFLA
jgi:hypothetical protein